MSALARAAALIREYGDVRANTGMPQYAVAEHVAAEVLTLARAHHALSVAERGTLHTAIKRALARVARHTTTARVPSEVILEEVERATLSRVAQLEAWLRGATEHEWSEPCSLDHHGDCQAHGHENPCPIPDIRTYFLTEPEPADLRHISDLPPDSLVREECAKGDVCKYISSAHPGPCETAPGEHA